MSDLSRFVSFTGAVLALCLIAAEAQAARKIFIGELSVHTTVAQVEEGLIAFGDIESVKIEVDTTRNSATAEVDFVEDGAADRAAAALDGAPCWDGTYITARILDELVVEGVIARLLAQVGMEMDQELDPVLSGILRVALLEAIERAQADGRRVVRADDLPCLAHRRRKPKEILVVGSKVKAIVEESGMVPAEDLVKAVSDSAFGILREAVRRARGNNRSTIRPYDL